MHLTNVAIQKKSTRYVGVRRRQCLHARHRQRLRLRLR